MTAKHAFICDGGPFTGNTIFLSVDGDQKTAIFTAKGKRGRYCGGHPVANRDYKITKNRKPAPALWEAV